MPQPFTLRDDDVSGLGQLYPVGSIAPSVPGKTDTLARANRVYGTITFPNGQGMQGVNVVIHRLEPSWNTPEAWESTSAVSGASFRRRSATPINKSVASSPSANMGSPKPTLEGAYDIFRTPLYDWEPWQNLVVSTQPINPLYIGAYAVGPYDSNSVAPSGSVTTNTYYVSSPYSQARVDFNISDAARGCQTNQDGIEAAPAALSSTGWWTGNLCSYGHTAWSTLSIKPGRSFTVEVIAQDEDSLATTVKSLPVIGIWNASDATGTLPSVASTPEAFNASVTGMTTLSSQASSQSQQLRIAIMDQRGDGRPDFAYQARVLYADSISPTTVPAKGGSITISGMGFRPGNTVSIHGFPAAVSGWTSNTLTVIAPTLHTSDATTADVTIRDLATGGTTTMIAALKYDAPQPELTLLSAPSGTVFAQMQAPLPFTVKALSADGVTPLPNTVVTLTASGQVRFEACERTSCTLSTDASGIVTSVVTPLASGSITLSASSSVGNITASFNAIPRIQTITALNPQLYLAQKAVISWTPQTSLADNAVSTLGVPVQWTALSGPIAFNPTRSFADAQSIAQTTATAGPLGGNTQATAAACAWTSICATFTVNGVNDADLRLAIVSGANQSIRTTASFAPITILVTDSSGHPVSGASVTIHQTLQPWSNPCLPQGRCPIAPTYESSTSTLISGLDGTVSLAPLETADFPEITRIAVVAGTEGFLAFSLQKHF
jgi:hypothetical protein